MQERMRFGERTDMENRREAEKRYYEPILDQERKDGHETDI